MAGASARSPIVWGLVASLLVYAAIASTRHWWLSAVAAPTVAARVWPRLVPGRRRGGGDRMRRS